MVTYNVNMDEFEEIKGDDILKAITKDIITSLVY